MEGYFALFDDTLSTDVGGWVQMRPFHWWQSFTKGYEHCSCLKDVEKQSYGRRAFSATLWRHVRLTTIAVQKQQYFTFLLLCRCRCQQYKSVHSCHANSTVVSTGTDVKLNTFPTTVQGRIKYDERASLCYCVCNPAFQSLLFRAVLYCHLCSAPFYNIFPYYLINGTIFGNKLLKTKCVFWFSLQLLSETFLILRRN
jgi:hypothetical protein